MHALFLSCIYRSLRLAGRVARRFGEVNWALSRSHDPQTYSRIPWGVEVTIDCFFKPICRVESLALVDDLMYLYLRYFRSVLN